MRKISINITLIAIISFSWSCKQEPSDNLTILNYSYKNDKFFVPLSAAIAAAENVDKSLAVGKVANRNSCKSPTSIAKRKIRNNLTIWDKEKQSPYFYVLNFETGGFAIIPADKRLMPIVGYSDNGSFVEDSIPIGLNAWFETTALQVKHFRTSNALPSAHIKHQWDNLQSNQNIMQSAPPDPENPDYTEVTVTVGPLLHTTWGQNCFYNTYCPVVSDGPCGHAKTGCSTTAIAQVMAYWKYPATYNWSGMPSNYGNDAVAVLMGDIFPNVISKYNKDASSCTNDFNIKNVFLNKFHYSSAALAGSVNGLIYNGGFNYQTVVSNLNAGEPVILGGYDAQRNILGLFSYPKISATGHTWVCDGYRQTTFTYETYLLFYMNWGWSGTFNGLYAFNDWTSPEGSYNYCTDMIYNIHP